MSPDNSLGKPEPAVPPVRSDSPEPEGTGTSKDVSAVSAVVPAANPVARDTLLGFLADCVADSVEGR